MEKAIPSFYNKPILGSFSVSHDDFRGHEGELAYDEDNEQLYYDYTDESSETPLGLIRQGDRVWVYKDKKDGEYWVKFTAAIWVKYNYKQVKKLLKSKDGHKKISVEIEVNDSTYDEDGIEHINDFTFDGVTILGDKYETGIADANLTILDMIDNENYQKKTRALAFAYNGLSSDEEIYQTSNIKKDAILLPENENPSEEIEMQQENSKEGGTTNPMELTYNDKYVLLEKALRKENEWSYLSDFDDTYIYYETSDSFYRAPYQISNADEGNICVIDFKQQEKVIRVWKVFEEELKGDSMENEVIKNEVTEETFAEEVCPDCGQNPCVCEKEEEACENMETEACENMETEACGEKEEEACENMETEACGEKEEEACENTERESCEDFSAEEPIEEIETSQENFVSTVEVDGEELDINALLEKYTELKSQFTALSESVKVQNAKALATFGENLINADTDVDEESKANFVAQVSEKCESYTLNSEAEVEEFATSLLAMYYYKNKKNEKVENSSEFSIAIENVVNETPASQNKLKDAINKLNHVN